MIIKLQVQPTQALIQQVSRVLGVRVIGNIKKGPYLLVRQVPKKGLVALSETNIPVEYIEPEVRMLLLPIVEKAPLPAPDTRELPRALDARSVPNDPYFRYQWGMQDGLFGIGLPTARARTRGAGIIVAILDTGIRQTASDLLQTKFMTGLNVIANNALTADDNGHGTHVCGTIAQSTDNNLGTAGVAPACTILPVKVLNAKGQGSNYSIGVGIRYAVDKGARVINMSIGGVGSQTLKDAIDYAYERNVIICAAAGNSGIRGLTFPAAYPRTLSVGATTSTGVRASFSQYGTGLTLVAPGSRILQQTFGVANNQSGYYYFSGTSMATPHVAGACAAILALNPAMTNDSVRSLLMSSARDLGGKGYDEQYGAGLLDLAAACERAGGNPPGLPVTPIPPTPGPHPTPVPPVVPPADPPLVPPVIVIPEVPPLAPNTEDERIAVELLSLFNGERAKAGLPAVARHAQLDSAALAHARDMRARSNLSHTGSDDSSPEDRITRAGYSWKPNGTWGEIIAAGQPTPAAVMVSWMNSPGHKAIILGAQFTEVGIAKQGVYWCAVFGRRGGVSAAASAMEILAPPPPAARSRGLPRPEQMVQIKLRDLLELVPRKASPDQQEIIARLKAIEERLAVIERLLRQASSPVQPPTLPEPVPAGGPR